jgi:hypothetical protein
MTLDETSDVMVDFAPVQGRVSDGLNVQGTSLFFLPFVGMNNFKILIFSDQRQSIHKDYTGDVLNYADSQDIQTQFGHLYLGPQSKCRYISSAFFAAINQEVLLLHQIRLRCLVYLRRLLKLITCLNNNSNTTLIPSFIFDRRNKTT